MRRRDLGPDLDLLPRPQLVAGRDEDRLRPHRSHVGQRGIYTVSADGNALSKVTTSTHREVLDLD